MHYTETEELSAIAAEVYNRMTDALPPARLAVGSRREDPQRLQPVQRKPLHRQRAAKHCQQRQTRRPGQRRRTCTTVLLIYPDLSSDQAEG